ncbi:MAG: pyrimidine 5'-nucleotidase [Anaerolineae bacterium]|nr:pyrimidine 5'-nucleotidase [Thermoflexales bacterium]MDW8406619.1 pyrimidine 5'-nucleotidase [Anaerolineae bacterium]
MFRVIFFDLDDTLYPRSAHLMKMIGARITEYMIRVIGMPPEQANVARRRWRDRYGTTLRGLLEEGYTFELDDFFRYVHDIPLDHVTPDPELRAMLLRLPLRRVVLTNSNSEHANRLLDHLHIADCFEQVIDIRALGLINKPDPRAYQLALDLAGVSAAESILVEDTPANTASARALGITTILVDCPPGPEADFFVPDVLAVETVVAGLMRPVA